MCTPCSSIAVHVFVEHKIDWSAVYKALAAWSHHFGALSLLLIIIFFRFALSRSISFHFIPLNSFSSSSLLLPIVFLRLVNCLQPLFALYWLLLNYYLADRESWSETFVFSRWTIDRFHRRTPFLLVAVRPFDGSPRFFGAIARNRKQYHGNQYQKTAEISMRPIVNYVGRQMVNRWKCRRILCTQINQTGDKTAGHQ